MKKLYTLIALHSSEDKAKDKVYFALRHMPPEAGVEGPELDLIEVPLSDGDHPILYQEFMRLIGPCDLQHKVRHSLSSYFEDSLAKPQKGVVLKTIDLLLDPLTIQALQEEIQLTKNKNGECSIELIEEQEAYRIFEQQPLAQSPESRSYLRTALWEYRQIYRSPINHELDESVPSKVFLVSTDSSFREGYRHINKRLLFLSFPLRESDYPISMKHAGTYLYFEHKVITDEPLRPYWKICEEGKLFGGRHAVISAAVRGPRLDS